MIKYYTRACNFYYGINAKLLVKKKLALPLCGNKNIAFDKLEIITRKNNKILSKIINIKAILKTKIKIVGCITVREKNGIPYSSRNFLLSSKEKKIGFKGSKSNKSNLITQWERDNTLDC